RDAALTAAAVTAAFTLSLHDALPIWARYAAVIALALSPLGVYAGTCWTQPVTAAALAFGAWWIVWMNVGRSSSTWPLGLALGIRSEEHTSELQSREKLVCRLLLEKEK